MLDDYVLVDLETTGTSNSDAIVEIGAIRVKDHKMVSSFELLVNPDRHIPEEVVSVHGITDEAVIGAPDTKQAMEAFLKFINEDDVIVGHNAKTFDMKYLIRDAKRWCGVDLTNQVHDSLYEARRKLPILGSHSLQSLSKYYNVSYEGAHRALRDCAILYQVFERLQHEEDVEENPICPDCGGKLKLRIGKYGWFWGCSNYPSCRFTKNSKGVM